jgi:hypothetical protein
MHTPSKEALASTGDCTLQGTLISQSFAAEMDGKSTLATKIFLHCAAASGWTCNVFTPGEPLDQNGIRNAAKKCLDIASKISLQRGISTSGAWGACLPSTGDGILLLWATCYCLSWSTPCW